MREWQRASQLPPFLEDMTTEALLELGISEADAKYSLFEHLLELSKTKLPKAAREAAPATRRARAKAPHCCRRRRYARWWAAA